MYCSNCGNLIKESDKFCGECGKEVIDSGVKKETIKEVPEKKGVSVNNEELRETEDQVNDYLPEDLKKAVKGAGDSVFALGIFSLILSPIIYILSFSETDDWTSFIIIILITTVVYVVLINFGNKIRQDNLEDLNITLKNISNTLIYFIVVSIFFILSGGWLGIWGIIALIQLFKAKKLLKANI